MGRPAGRVRENLSGTEGEVGPRTVAVLGAGVMGSARLSV
jgi:hypothetical protein